MLLLLSFNVIKKPHYQQAEIDLADAHQKTIIPLLIDTVRDLARAAGQDV